VGGVSRLGSSYTVSQFDPYYQWLAIPPAEQPPNYYRLLGVTLFEPNLDVISAAADRQMLHVRGYQQGPHGENSQRLLNELSNARLTLLRPETKAPYDARLRQQLGQGANPLKVATPLKMATPLTAAAPQPVAQPQAQPRPRPQPTAPTHTEAPVESARPHASSAEARRPRKRSKGRPTGIIGVVAGGVIGIYLALVILNYVGIDLPAGVRSWPGLHPVKPQEHAAQPAIKPAVPPEHHEPAVAVVEPTSNEPWPENGAGFMPIRLDPGRHEFSFMMDKGGAPRVRIDSRGPTGSPIPGRILSLGEVVARSKGTVTGVGSDETSMFVNCSAANAGVIAIGVTAPPNATITQAGIMLQATAAPPHDGVRITGGVYRSLDITRRQYSGKVADFKSLLAAQAQNAYFGETITCNERSVFLIASLHPPHQTPENLRLWLNKASPPFATVVVTAGQNVVGGNTSVPATTTTSGALSLTPQGAWQPEPNVNPKTMDEQVTRLRATLGSLPPRETLMKASAEPPGAARLALIKIAAQDAVTAGDVVLASAAYQRLRSGTSQDLASDEATALATLFRASKPGFQPAAFAAWSVDVLERLETAGKLPQHQELATMALRAATESGDRDLLRSAARVASALSPGDSR
jgi:hypothetical protein